MEVASAGYETAKQDVDFDNIHTRSDLSVSLQPVADGGVGHASGLVLEVPSKAQKHVQKGLAELQAGDLTEALKELTAAYNAAPENSYICYLLGDAKNQTSKED